jgi:hypothetical protein
MDGATSSQTSSRKLPMTHTHTNIITVVDRFALGLLNAMALVGVPLVAIGVLTQSF